MEKYFLIALLLAFTWIQGNVCEMRFQGKRNLTGDLVDRTINNTRCLGVVGAKWTEGKCLCQFKRPIFHMQNNRTYICYQYKDLCADCSGVQSASFRKLDTVETFNTTVKSINDRVLAQCPPNQRTAALSILDDLNYVQVYIGPVAYSMGSVSITMQVNVSLSPSLLEGKLGRLQVWCENSTVEEIDVMRSKHAVFVVIQGQFNYPDNDVYVPMTTTTTTTTPIPPVSPSANKSRRGSKELLFYIVIPIAAFLLLVAIILVFVNQREKKQKKNSYTLKKLEEERSEDGMFNPAFQTSTINRNGGPKPIMNNNGNMKRSNNQKMNDDIKIYTVVDLSNQSIAEVPILQNPVLEQQQVPITKMTPPNYFPHFDETFADDDSDILDQSENSTEFPKQYVISSVKTDNDFLKDEKSGNMLDDISITKEASDGDSNSIRKDSVSSDTDDDHDDDEKKFPISDDVDSEIYHSDGSMSVKEDHDVDCAEIDDKVIIVKPPSIEESENDIKKHPDFEIIGDNLI